jgi:hypothetical protein
VSGALLALSGLLALLALIGFYGMWLIHLMGKLTIMSKVGVGVILPTIVSM